jgi:hypothetical protein
LRGGQPPGSAIPHTNRVLPGALKVSNGRQGSRSTVTICSTEKRFLFTANSLGPPLRPSLPETHTRSGPKFLMQLSRPPPGGRPTRAVATVTYRGDPQRAVVLNCRGLVTSITLFGPEQADRELRSNPALWSGRATPALARRGERSVPARDPSMALAALRSPSFARASDRRSSRATRARPEGDRGCLDS